MDSEKKETRTKDSITAVIFDMDDLMINSHPINMDILEAVLNKYGTSLKETFTVEEEIQNSGLKISDYFQYLIDKYSLHNKANSQKMTQQFDELILPVFEKADVVPMPGLISLVQALKKNNFKLAIASSAKREKIELVIKKLQLEDIFDVIVSGEDDIKHGKPAPDIFLKTAEKLGLDPWNCLVIEDAENGIKAAQAAGMYTIGVHNQFNRKKLGLCQKLDLADKQFNSLKEVSIEIVRGLVSK